MNESLPSAEKDVPDFAWAEMLTHQECAAKKHPDWFINSEHNLLCPWCEIDRLQAGIAAALALADEWQANYDRWANVGTGVPRVEIMRAHANRLHAALDTRVTPPGVGDGS